jgi:hypothetical protein
MTCLRVALACGALGCAMSREAFNRMAGEVAGRNQQRREEAEQDLARRGYTRIEDADVRFAQIEKTTRDECMNHGFRQLAPGTEEPSLEISIAERKSGTPPAPGVVEVVAPARATCEFFSLQTPVLEVTMADGEKLPIVRIPGPRRLAKGPRGETVRIVERAEVISRDKALVKEVCNRMPRPEPHPLELTEPVTVLWGKPAEPPTVELLFEREELEEECTEYVE